MTGRQALARIEAVIEHGEATAGEHDRAAVDPRNARLVHQRPRHETDLCGDRPETPSQAPELAKSSADRAVA